jgi:phage tail sheath protein FI
MSAGTGEEVVMISPGVSIREIDKSYYGSSMSPCVVGLVGTALKGPMNKPILVTSVEEFISTFGSPDPLSHGMFAAVQVLQKGDQLLYVRVPGNDASAATAISSAFTFTAVSYGVWGNDITVSVANTVATTDAVPIYTFDVTVSYAGSVVEEFVGLTTDATNAKFVGTILGSNAEDGNSGYIYLANLAAGTPVTDTVSGVALATGANGAMDALNESGSPLLGDAAAKTGIYALANPEDVKVNVISVPGLACKKVTESGAPAWNTADALEVVQLAQSRGDCIAVVDAPPTLSVDEVVTWSKAFDSSFSANYWPWVKVMNAQGMVEVHPPSGPVIGVYEKVWNERGPWRAPAGLNNGVLTTVCGLTYNPSLSEREKLYKAGQAVNAICNYRGKGIVIWGEKTSQKTATALDRVNVRNLLGYLKQAITDIAVGLLFEPNDQRTWAAFSGCVDPILQNVMDNEGLYDYKIVCDKTTVTDDAINRNEMPANIFIQPTKDVEFIKLSIIITATGAKFE